MGVLADWVVQIRQNGADEAKKGVDDVGKKLEQSDKKAKGIGASLFDWTKWLGIGAAAFGVIAKALQETEGGKALAESFQKLGSILVQAVEPVLQMMANVIEAVAPVIAQLVSLLIPVFELIGGIVKEIASFVSSVIQPVLDTLISALEFLGISVPKVEAKKKDEEKKGKSSFEAGDAVFKRIQESIAGGNVEQQQLEWLKQGVNAMVNVREAILKTQPAVG